jgi:hypothetical protein
MSTLCRDDIVGSDCRPSVANDDLHGTWLANGDRYVGVGASQWLDILDELPTFLLSASEVYVLFSSFEQ